MNICPLGTPDKNIAGSKYRILGPIGQGQFGQVFCGIHRSTGQVVALKQLDNHRLTTPRFLHELNLLASLQHPNIVEFHTLEYSGSGRYLVMDYCEGGTLRQLINAPSQPLSLQQALQLVIDVVQGLEHAHQHGVVHCDLKPENVLLTLTATGWTAHLSDFGVARWLAAPDPETRRGDTGSPAYMAPERFYSDYSPASDLYAAGVLLYELAVGKRPFSGTPGDLMTAHLNQPLEVPDKIPTLVSDIIRQATQKLPQKRFTSAQAMLKALRLAAVEERPTAAPPPLEPPVLQTTALISPILSLTAEADQLYCGLDSQVICQSITPAGFGEPVQFPMPQGKVIQMWNSSQGLLISTQRGSDHTLSWLPLDSQKQASQDSPVQTIGSWQSKSLQMTVESDGKWLGIATPDRCQVLRLPMLQPLSCPPGSPTQLLALDRRHGIMAIPETQGVRLRLFNRRGHTFDYCRLPLPVNQLIQSQAQPHQVLALAAEVNFWINLAPLQIKRIALPISPTFGAAAHWGYLLADQAGGIALVNGSGDLIRHLHLPLGDQEVVSAIATHQSQLIAATWSGHTGTLYSIDLQPFLKHGEALEPH